MFILIWFFGFAFSVSPRAEAYSISTHVMLTRRAAEEYEICRKTNGLKELPVGAVETLSRSNAFEDYAFWIKALNWHFYHPTKDLGAGTLGLGHGSLRWRFENLEKVVKSEHSLKALGGLLHYVQDLTNPAHVAPIFHMMSDSFDNFEFDRALPPVISEAECLQLKTHEDPKRIYFEVLDRVSQETLTTMDESFQMIEDGKPRMVRWRDAFWNPDFGADSKQIGFGHYGNLGNHFGSSTIANATINQGTYLDFARRQIRAALNASVLFIEMYQSKAVPD